ncbi:MAG: SIMPL domain-containing protein [Oscillospiraceae bacterium]|nr:SIMPL domain-containing protein [Oscillospiraceae bacterium]
MAENRTMRVTGNGKLRLAPDCTRITINLNGIDKDYGESLRRSSEETDTLADVLAGFGFARDELKTLSFSVDAEYEGYQDKDGCWQQRFAGYRFRHMLKVEFPSDNERLGKVLYALANCPVDPELRLSWFVSDRDAAANALLGNAVADAKEKAAVLAEAAGVRLGDIRSIDYSWGELDLAVRPMAEMRLAKNAAADCAGSYDMNIAPDDIEISDTVTVVWELV